MFGITENLDNINDLLDQIPKEITPPLQEITHSEIPIINHQGKQDRLLLFNIGSSHAVHSIRSGHTYLRHGRSNRRLTAEEIIRLKYAKGEISVESEPAPEVKLSDLDQDLLQKFKADVGVIERDLWTFLFKNGLAVRYKRSFALNKAGVLLFGHIPAISLKSKCSIKIAQFRGNAPVYSGTPNLTSRPKTIEGPLLRQIQGAYAFLRSLLASSPVLKGATFESSLPYPAFALQEAITNAVIHRDYSIQDDIQIRVYDNRIEFISPGRLPAHITLSNIRTERFARNPIILWSLNRFSDAPNLDIGEGVKRIFLAMQEAHLVDPVYYAPKDQHLVKLTLFNTERDPYWDQGIKELADCLEK
ncbi:MAG: ATP-binding protein, partial [Candidatus Zixiibacteriota bacterium]